ncbi:MAG: hypothetical protein IKS51_05295 [Erysipelotrichaceae bacterium]|nr:hypothetical protein [Erysipelotrichaceae bacterium]
MNKKLFDHYIIEKKQKNRRIEAEEVCGLYSSLNLSEEERMIRRFEYLMSLEELYFLDEEQIPFVRTVSNTPEIYTPEEWEERKKKHYIHESGYRSNLCPDYEKVLRYGLLKVAESGSESFKRMVHSILELTGKYEQEARRHGLHELADMLKQVPASPARTFHEALLCLRILNFAIWVEGNYQISLGRFDQYLYPYLEKDLNENILNEQEAYELLSEFFLSLNKDNDIYPGVQPGDNGQSLMLGGKTKDGSYLFNKISRMSLEVCEELKLIDPKINIRVDRDTPEEVYLLGTRLTKVGLGFPQYSNDDVVIPGLLKLGYDYEDAVEYVVAACWEFIIPKVADDVVNIAALSFPKTIDTCLHRDLVDCNSYEEFLDCVRKQLEEDIDGHRMSVNGLRFVCAPLLEGLMDWKGKAKYVNYGMHGVGLSTAVDSLTAIQIHIYEKKDIGKEELIKAVDEDFKNDPVMLHLLRHETEKLGSNDERSNRNLQFLIDRFGTYLNNKPNDQGGIWRAGTGSAMYYLWYADEIGASADGRRKKEPFAANYSVSLFADVKPFSLLKAMTSPDLTQVINGGPLTLEFHSSVFASDDAIRSVAAYVRQFILQGGHQLQLNTVNADTLRDAQKHPENYPLLIVRIWGWSAYFVELDKAYQNHVIMRQEYRI